MSTINTSSLTAIPSLADYLSKSTQTGTNSLGFTQYNTGATDLSSYLNQTDSGDTVSFSPQAQALMQQAQNSTSTGSTSSTSGTDSDDNQAKTGARAFLASFFEDSGIDSTKELSTEALSLLNGLSGMIDDMQSPTENAGLDRITNSYSKGARGSFTLQEDNHTISFMVKYTNGKPDSMTVTNVTGTKAETAVIKLGKDATTGGLTGVNVTSEVSTYNSFGNQTGSVAGDALHFDLYATDSTKDSSSAA